MNDLRRGFRELGWVAWLMVGVPALLVVATLSVGAYRRAFEWACTIVVCLVFLRLAGIITRQRDRIKALEWQVTTTAAERMARTGRPGVLG